MGAPGTESTPRTRLQPGERVKGEPIVVLEVSSVSTEAQPVLSKVEQRNLNRLEKAIAGGLQTFREVGAALLEIRDSRLYRETHATFEAYCSERWAMPRSRAYQLIESAKVVDALGDPDGMTNEAQARELSSLGNPAEMKTVWEAAEARAEETNRPVTAALIRRVRGEVLPATTNGPAHDSPTDRLMQDIVRLGNAYQRWKDTKPNVGQRQKVKAALTKLLAVIG